MLFALVFDKKHTHLPTIIDGFGSIHKHTTLTDRLDGVGSSRLLKMN